MHGRSRYILQLQHVLAAWLFCFLSLCVCRLTFLIALRHEVAPATTWREWITCCATGSRFDCMVSTYWMLPCVVACLVCQWAPWESVSGILRRATMGLYAFLTPFLCVASIEYYREFGDVFNHTILQFLGEDVAAAGTTMIREYHLVPYSLLSVAISGAGYWTYRRFFSGDWLPVSWQDALAATRWRRCGLNLVVCGLVVLGLRASLGRQPAKLKTAGVTSDRLLNKAVLNPYYAIKTAVAHYRTVTSEQGLHNVLPGADVVGAVRFLFPESSSSTDLRLICEKSTPAAGGDPLDGEPITRTRPKHIFLVVMESYDAWPFLDRYQSLNLVNEGKRLARDGVHFQSFLPAATTSMPSVAAIVTSLPYVELQLQLSAAAAVPLESSLPMAMRRLGYQTRYFCGGYLSWSDIGEFMRRQGFEEVYGAGDIEAPGAINEWGVNDERLFQFVRETIHDEQPSFSVIQTSSYHAPYDLDLKSLGFPLHEFPEDLADDLEHDAARQLRIYGHLWYSDRALGRFVRHAEAEYERTLFAITGDHFGRQFLNSHPTLFEETAVPLILYGPRVLRDLNIDARGVGGHVDISPTLIEIAAPPGFRYHAYGNSLLRTKRWPVAVGLGVVMTADYVSNLYEATGMCRIPGRDPVGEPPPLSELAQYYQSLRGLAWWRVKRGPLLPVPPQVID